LRGLARRLWPELVALLGLVGWQLAGPTAVALVLVLVGALGRLLLVAQALRRLGRPPGRPSTMVAR
jgi:hypothetical protein